MAMNERDKHSAQAPHSNSDIETRHHVRRDNLKLLIEIAGLSAIIVGLFFTGAQFRQLVKSYNASNELLALELFIPRVEFIDNSIVYDGGKGRLHVFSQARNNGALPVAMTEDFYFDISGCNLNFSKPITSSVGDEPFARSQTFSADGISVWRATIENFPDNVANLAKDKSGPGSANLIVRIWRVAYVIGQERFDFFDDIKSYGGDFIYEGESISIPKFHSKINTAVELLIEISSDGAVLNVKPSDNKKCVPLSNI